MNLSGMSARELWRCWRVIMRRLPSDGFPSYGWDWPTLSMIYPHTARVLRALAAAYKAKVRP